MNAAFGQLVGHLQLFYVGRVHLGRQAVGGVLQGGGLRFELTPQEGQLVGGVVELFAVGRAVADQLREAFDVLSGLGDLLSGGRYLLVDVGTLGRIDQSGGPDLARPQVQLHRVDQSQQASGFYFTAFLGRESQQASGLFGRNGNFGGLECARGVKLFVVGGAARQQQACNQ